MKEAINSQFPIIGWREWLALPDLKIPRIKAKVDTGARTSALHAFWIDAYSKKNQPWIRFAIHPIQNNIETVIECDAQVKDRRIVADSGGHKQLRYVIETPVCLGAYVYVVELTLTQRDIMRFRMLLGRTAINNRFLVNPGASYLQGRL
ncbi:MAG TPA: ATP-dependent zinc protease [Nitrosomonas sp.]|nr:ATP-dependent zinc protease [Nitrosomonas sp.]